MKKRKRIFISFGLAGVSTLGLAVVPSFAHKVYADVTVPQGVSDSVLQQTNYFGDMDPNTKVTVDIVLKVQNSASLAQFINGTVTPGSANFRRYSSVQNFRQKYAPGSDIVNPIVAYLKLFGISTSVFPDNLVITANGTVGQFNKAFNVQLLEGSYKGKTVHFSEMDPRVPEEIANNILCILGLSDYSNFTSQAIKRQAVLSDDSTSPTGPLNLTPKDLENQYDVSPLYAKGATGAGQTIGIVTLAEFNPEDAYSFWKDQNIPVSANRIKKTDVDGGSGWNNYDETTLDVEQSGALAPGANMNVYVGPNSDTGFVDAWAKAINDNVAQQISVSWGESETAITYLVNQGVETPEYAQVFNQLFMQAAAQGISTFAPAGDSGAYSAERDLGTYDLSVLNPADSPYITAAGGTTLPFHFHSSAVNMDVGVSKERAWGWDYLYPYFDAHGLNNPAGWAQYYFVGGGGGFSPFFPTPDYQQGVSGVNTFTAEKEWTPSADYTSVTRDATPTEVKGTGSGRNLPDLSMDADPYTGYAVYLSDPGQPGVDGGYRTYGGTSVVAPQLCGLSALINSADHTKVGFWNPQIYRFAGRSNSPLHPLNDSGISNDNVYYSGTPGTIFNQATGLGTPDIAALANRFAGK